MPTTYTHDVFGKKIYRQLPKDVRRLIKKHGDLYRIGLHGPDIFFYQLLKARVNRFGVQMHREKARAFFEQGMAQVRETGDEEVLVYLLGFGCHYLLDSVCHPFVGEMADRKIVNHTLLEKEFDRTLLEEEGYDPLLKRPADALVPKMEYAAVIHRVMPLISEKEIYESLKMQKFLLNRMVYGRYGILKKAVDTLVQFFKKEDVRELGDHFMRRLQAKESYLPIRRLRKLFDRAVEESAPYLMELYGLSKEEKILSGRWDHTYNG